MPEYIWDALSVFGAVIVILLVVSGAVFAVVWAGARLAQRGLVDEAYEQATEILLPRQPDGSHDNLGRDDYWRNREVGWLKQLYGPPVIPRRDQ